MSAHRERVSLVEELRSLKVCFDESFSGRTPGTSSFAGTATLSSVGDGTDGGVALASCWTSVDLSGVAAGGFEVICLPVLIITTPTIAPNAITTAKLA